MKNLSESGFRYGIEHEVALITPAGAFSDFSNTSFEELDRIIKDLPRYSSDYPKLRVGDLGMRDKRWYIETFWRCDEQGNFLRADVKGIEIRTPVARTIGQAVRYLRADYGRLARAAAVYGYTLVATSFNPHTKEFVPDPPLNSWERAQIDDADFTTGHIYQLTYGPDVNLSHRDLTPDDLIDIGKKLNYYSPYIVPFSFSAPFRVGEPYGGLSQRTSFRNGQRSSAKVFLADESKVIKSNPELTVKAHVPQEAGRIEFKAFDTCADLTLYGGLLALIKGVVLDDTLPGRALIPDSALLAYSAQRGLHEDGLREHAAEVVAAAERTLPAADRDLLDPLKRQLASHRCLADDQLDDFARTGDILQTLRNLSPVV